jgi:AcrR family transcriptional regulator
MIIAGHRLRGQVLTNSDHTAVDPSTPHAASEVLEHSYPGARSALKREILLAALACFNEHGLESTTIDMIKAHCGTSVGNIYHHFGNKEGVIAALFLSALNHQSAMRERYLAAADSAADGIRALVHSYVDWVTQQPALARFQYQARSAVANGPMADELKARNHQRNRQLKEWVAQPARRQALREWPAELFPSLIIGPAESYCRAWLSGRVKTSPQGHRDALAEAAWAAVAQQPSVAG